MAPGSVAASTQEPSPVLAAPPESVNIPVIAVDDTQVEIYTKEMVQANGGVNPTSPDIISWWQDGGMPGEDADNTVYLYGHTWNGPAVFNRLKELEDGDVVHVKTGNGELRYVVNDMFTVAKPELTSDPRVTEGVPGRLVLIACWRETGNEPTTTHNLVVVAELEP